MLDYIYAIIHERIVPLIKKEIGKITAINRKYAEPGIKITRGVSMVLLLLRFYLVFLVLLLGYKFFEIIRG
jgi:hypothetical protein